MLFREFRIAIANGVALGIVGALGTLAVLHDPSLSVVFGVALVINSLVAGLVGVLVPLTLDKARIDPAVSSAVFVTTMTDVMGFFSFLGLAALFLSR
jgi:magnesium transporter